MQHTREAFERWTSILNRDSASDHGLISAVYLIIFPISCANAIPKSSDTTDGRIHHNHVSHCQVTPSSSVEASFVMQIQMKQTSSWKCRFFSEFSPGPCLHPDLRLMGNFSLDWLLESHWGFREVSIDTTNCQKGGPGQVTRHATNVSSQGEWCGDGETDPHWSLRKPPVLDDELQTLLLLWLHSLISTDSWTEGVTATA